MRLNDHDTTICNRWKRLGKRALPLRFESSVYAMRPPGLKQLAIILGSFIVGRWTSRFSVQFDIVDALDAAVVPSQAQPNAEPNVAAVVPGTSVAAAGARKPHGVSAQPQPETREPGNDSLPSPPPPPATEPQHGQGRRRAQAAMHLLNAHRVRDVANDGDRPGQGELGAGAHDSSIPDSSSRLTATLDPASTAAPGGLPAAELPTKAMATTDCRHDWTEACELNFRRIHRELTGDDRDGGALPQQIPHAAEPPAQKTTPPAGTPESPGELVVVGSLTTTPPRIKLLNETLWSLVTQTRKLDAILVIVPFDSTRLGENYTMPDWLEEYGHGVIVIRTQEDWGPAGKLIPAVAISMMPRDGPAAAGEWLHAPPYSQGSIRTRGGGLAKMTPRTRIITFDDDRIYKPWLVELYTIVSLRRPDCIVGADAHTLNTRMYTSDPTRCATALTGGQHDSKTQRRLGLQSAIGSEIPMVVSTVPGAKEQTWSQEATLPLDRFNLKSGIDLLLGCGGVMYQPWLLNLRLLTNITMLQNKCFHVDDVFFASLLEQHGTNRIRVHHPSLGETDWSNRRGRADNIKPLLHSRALRYAENCACALSFHHELGVWNRA